MRAAAGVFALTFVLAVAAPAHAQTGDALLKAVTSYTPVPNPSFPVPPDAVYRAVWDASKGTERPGDIDPVFLSVASFLVMAEEAGIPRGNVKAALVVHGNSARNLLQHDAYRAMTGVDNPNIPILEALHARGVLVIICGQSIPNRKLPGDKLLPFVQVSLSATFAHVTLHSQGYFQF
jgi:intracellular sulfur oxidation DsrE/DsrF family protein